MKRLSLPTLAVLFAAACGSDNPPGIQLFTAALPSIALGDSTELVFTAENGATLSIDQGVGNVTGRTSVSVSPTVTTTYTLTATKLGMSTTSKTTVTVGHGAASQLTLSGLASELAVDAPATVTVTVRDRFGNPVTDYTGTLRFALTDTAATPIADVTFTAAMQGTTTIQVSFLTDGAQSLTATDTAFPSLSSSTTTQVRAGGAVSYSLSPLPASSIAGDPVTLTITARDSHGNVVKNYAGTAHVSSTDPTDRLPADGGFTGGVRTVSLGFVTAGNHSVTVSEAGGTVTANTTSVAVAAAAATQVALLRLPSDLSVDTPATVTVTVRDRFGNVATGYRGTLHFVLTDTGATAIPDVTFTAAMQGTTTIQVSFVTDGAQSLTATDTALASLSSSATTQVRAGAAVAYSLSPLPASSIAGEPVTLTISARDSHGNVVKNYAGTAHVSSTDPTDRLPADGGFTGGVRTMSLGFVTAGNHLVTVSEAGGTVTANTTSVAVAAAAATQVALLGLPSDLSVDTPATVTVTVRDRFGNVATGYRGTLHFVLTDAAATPIADVTFTAAMQGTTTIQVSFVTSGEQSVIATETVNASLTSSTITQVRAGNATTYSLSALPASALAGEPLSLAITARDSHGNVVKNYAGTAHVTSTDPSDRLPLDGGFTSGVRTVSLAFLSAASHLATVNEAGGTISVNTTSVNVVSGDAADLLVSGASTTAGASASATVTAKDTFGNTVGSYVGTVAFSSTDAQATLPSNFTFATADAGQHTFPVTLKTAGVQTVSASDAAHSLSGSGGFSVAPANATNCSVTGLPVSAGAGAQLGLRVTVKDDFANAATGYAGTIALSSSDGTAQLSAAAAFTGTDAGSRAFSAQLRTAGPQTVTAADSASSISCQGSVTIMPGATLFAVTFTGTDAWAGTAVPATVRAQDSFGNGVTNYAGTVAFASSDAAAVKPANVTLNGTEGGTANVNVTFNTVGSQTLTATDTVASAATGTGLQTVHGLVYTDPASGGKVRLIRNVASSASAVQLDLVSNATLFNTSTGATGRNGAFAAGMNLPLDATKVSAGSPLINTAAPAGSGAVLNLGTTGTPRAIGAVLNATNAVLYSGISQKRSGTPAAGTTPVVLGDATLRPFPGGNSFYYSLTLRLVAGATAGTVFDGTNLGSKFHAAVRDRSGTDVFQNADFAIGKLEVR